MNILVINHYSGSNKLGMVFRPFYMAREWIKQGHRVTIVGAAFSHLRKFQPIVNTGFNINFIDGIKFIWLKTPEYNSSFRRILNILTFLFRLYYYTKLIIKESKPDVVIVSSTYCLDIYSSHRIAKITGARLCFEVRDLWPLSPMEIGGYSKWNPFIMIIQMAENYAYKNSDVVISLLDKSFQYMQKHGLKAEKFKVVPNGFCSDEWDNNNEIIPTEHDKLISQLKKEQKIIVGYAGSFNPSNSLSSLLNAAKLLEGRPELVFILVGNGPIKEELIQISDSKDQKNIYFLPPVSKMAIPDLIRRFDIAYMGGVKSILHKYGTSYNKMTDYMLSAKPIVFESDEPNSLVEKLSCGITVPANMPQQAAEAINNLAGLTASERLEMGLKGKKYVELELEYSGLSKKMLNYIINS